ncbi:hypothetical protein [Chamaesiphon sp. OTE_75_metabat_556]|nr:hypothetical protein [Chamaesiphon sp. OTE_75_metabat_556]
MTSPMPEIDRALLDGGDRLGTEKTGQISYCQRSPVVPWLAIV